MRSNLYEKIDSELSLLGERLSGPILSLERRMQVSITPNAILSWNSRLFRSKNSRLACAIFSWWIPEGFGTILSSDLIEDREMLVRLAAHSKAGALEVLYSNFSERDFFGNFLPLLRKVARLLRIFLKKQSVSKRIERHRGYRDHGTLRPPERWTEKYDLTLTQKQQEIELSREIDSDTFQFLLGFAGLV